MSTVNFQSMIATKASRLVTASKRKSVIKFGLNTTHGPQTTLLADRARLYRWLYRNFNFLSSAPNVWLLQLESLKSSDNNNRIMTKEEQR